MPTRGTTAACLSSGMKRREEGGKKGGKEALGGRVVPLGGWDESSRRCGIRVHESGCSCVSARFIRGWARKGGGAELVAGR